MKGKQVHDMTDAELEAKLAELKAEPVQSAFQSRHSSTQ